jgi:hypothetical protein
MIRVLIRLTRESFISVLTSDLLRILELTFFLAHQLQSLFSKNSWFGVDVG